MRYIKKITEYHNEYDTDGNVTSSTESSRVIEYRGYKMRPIWYLNNGWLPYDGTEPVERLSIADGVITVLPLPEPLHEWANKEWFVEACRVLVPAEAIAAIMADPVALKGVLADMTLLTTDAAPGNSIDLKDPKVVNWLSLSGLTVEQVKNKMEELTNAGA